MLKKRHRKELKLKSEQGRFRQDYYWPRCWHPLRLADILSRWLIKSLGILGINKASNKYDPLTSPHLPPTEQKSLLINLSPSPSTAPVLSPSPCHTPVFLESVSCFVSFCDKFLLGFCLLLFRFFFFYFLYFIFCFFLLLFYATLCFAINFAGQLLRLRAAARMPHNARHYCLRFLHSVCPSHLVPSPIILPRATSIYGGFAEITLKFSQVNCICNKKHRSVNGNCAIKIEQKPLQQNI